MFHPAFRRLLTMPGLVLIALEKIEADVAQDGEILRCIAATDAATVFAESYVQ